MQYFKRVPKWTLLPCLILLGISAESGNQIDPTIDFSFSLGKASRHEALNKYRLMPESKVAAILSEHLDVTLSRTEAKRLAQHLVQLSRKHRFDPALILSLIEVESTFRTQVVSPAGAVGLMQIMPATAERVAKKEKLPYEGPESLKNPYINLSIGVAYLASLRDRYAGLSPYFQFAAYNLGPGKLDELRANPDFKPVKTKEYYEKVKRGVSNWRYYQANAKKRLGKQGSRGRSADTREWDHSRWEVPEIKTAHPSSKRI